MTYDQVMAVLVKYVPLKVGLFADKWNRFPRGEVAASLCKTLEEKISMWKLIDDGVTNQLKEVLRAIKDHQ
ncbi:MAG: hypothetical protein SVK08_01570 [Halobacteriota archaeon]|nr:hypothetical protein [Halobacteriota archaeon]